MRAVTILISGICLFLTACAVPYPVNLSKFSDKFSCLPGDATTTPIAVSMFYNGLGEGRTSGELVFLVTVRNSNKEFLTVWSYGENEATRKGEWEKYAYYAKTEADWEYIGSFKIHDSMTPEEQISARATMYIMTEYLKDELPMEYQLMPFKKLWEEAGCTTHGPVPFWW